MIESPSSPTQYAKPQSMTLQVYYFASLRELLGKSEEKADISDAATTAELWCHLNPDHGWSSSILCAVNHTYATADHALCDGDEIAFFPTVTGG